MRCLFFLQRYWRSEGLFYRENATAYYRSSNWIKTYYSIPRDHFKYLSIITLIKFCLSFLGKSTFMLYCVCLLSSFYGFISCISIILNFSSHLNWNMIYSGNLEFIIKSRMTCLFWYDIEKQFRILLFRAYLDNCVSKLNG